VSELLYPVGSKAAGTHTQNNNCVGSRGHLSIRSDSGDKTSRARITMQLCRFTTGKYQLICSLDLNSTTVLVGVDSPDRGVLAKARP